MLQNVVNCQQMYTKRNMMPKEADTKFYTWLRSGLRKLSRRWPPVYEALAKAKVKYVGDNPRRKWSYVCAECKDLFEQKQVAVDHIEPAGALKSKDDIAAFVTQLFCEADGLQVLCKECHDKKTYAERMGISFEEASIEKNVITFKKLPVSAQKDWLTQYYDCATIATLTNTDKRAEAYRQYLKGKRNEQA